MSRVMGKIKMMVWKCKCEIDLADSYLSLKFKAEVKAGSINLGVNK